MTQCTKAHVTCLTTKSGKLSFFWKSFPVTPIEGETEVVRLHRLAQLAECKFYSAIRTLNLPHLPKVIAVDDHRGILLLEDIRGETMKMQEPPIDDFDTMQRLLNAYATLQRAFTQHLTTLKSAVATRNGIRTQRDARWSTVCANDVNEAATRARTLCAAFKVSSARGEAALLAGIAQGSYSALALKLNCDASLDAARGNDVCTVLQGDANPNNIMLRRNAAQRDEPEIVIVDWQEPCVGHPLFDIAWLLLTSMSPASRRSQEATLLKSYVCRLTACVDDDYDTATWREAYERVLLLSAIYIAHIVGAAGAAMPHDSWLYRLTLACIDVIEQHATLLD